MSHAADLTVGVPPPPTTNTSNRYEHVVTERAQRLPSASTGSSREQTILPLISSLGGIEGTLELFLFILKDPFSNSTPLNRLIVAKNNASPKISFFIIITLTSL